MTETVRCGWSNEAFPLIHPDFATFHKTHGDDMTQCDAWVCPCGNDSDTGGFAYVNDKHEDIEDPSPEFSWFGWRCDKCDRVFNKEGRVVGFACPVVCDNPYHADCDCV